MDTIVTNDIKYVGVNDRDIDLFEGQYIVENGMAYNSYVILDKKIAVMDSVDANFKDEWLDNLADVLGDKTPDYLIVQHMEPDHSANIDSFAEKYPDAQIVASAQAFNMMKNFFGTDFSDRRIVVKEGDTLELGEHTLTFITAPMVHWPEVIMTYDSRDKVLFSADGFGKFGTQVQNVLKKAAALEIQTICPLHGPILKENLDYYLGLYNTWSSYGTESEGVVIAYTSVYGHTKAAVELLAQKLNDAGCPKVAVTDLARDDMAEAVEDAFRYGTLVLATTTYNADIFPFMREFINHLTERNFSNRTIAFVENGSWAPTAAKVMRKMLEDCKNIKFAENTVTIKSALSDDNRAQIDALAAELAKDFEK